LRRFWCVQRCIYRCTPWLRHTLLLWCILHRTPARHEYSTQARTHPRTHKRAHAHDDPPRLLARFWIYTHTNIYSYYYLRILIYTHTTTYACTLHVCSY
jgi:hypothetical protein